MASTSATSGAMDGAGAPASMDDAHDAAAPAEGAAALNGLENRANSSGSDDQTSLAPGPAVPEQAGADTTPAESDPSHAQITREAAAEANNVAGEAPASGAAAPIDVSIAMMPEGLEQALAAVAAAAAAAQQQQMQQQPSTSSAQPLCSAASPVDSMAGQASDSNGGAAEVDILQVAARLQRKEQPAFIQTSALISNVSDEFLQIKRSAYSATCQSAGFGACMHSSNHHRLRSVVGC